MTDRLLDKYRQSSADDKQGSLGPCVLLAEKPPFALEFRKQDGTRIALPVGLLQCAVFEPSGKILLTFNGFDVSVWGRTLGSSFDALLLLRVKAFVEHDTLRPPSAEADPVVLGIQITPTR